MTNLPEIIRSERPFIGSCNKKLDCVGGIITIRREIHKVNDSVVPNSVGASLRGRPLKIRFPGAHGGTPLQFNNEIQDLSTNIHLQTVDEVEVRFCG